MDRLTCLFSALQNGQSAKKTLIRVPCTKNTKKLLNIFLQEKYIQDFYEENCQIVIVLKYEGNSPMFQRIQRISRPGRRVYCSYDRISPEKFSIFSTSKGIMSGRDALNLRIGGEFICEISVSKSI
uniref:Ribosomal protein S8 n=1 Tax=Nephroselmis olivacea TaxID=31312 RepID=Q9TCB5_NEPOL|nr:ribosomal protein S8 [Nephroselmis olivacea]AAF03182.1 ribosomal protein S8 [Nephroselmis olivacea]